MRVVSFHFFVLFLILKDSLQSQTNKKKFNVSVYYDNTYVHSADIATHSSEIVNRQLGDSSNFELTINLHRVSNTEAYRLIKEFCTDISQGHIAIIAIGISPSFRLLSAIAFNLNVPFITINHEHDSINSANLPTNSAIQKYQILHMHPPLSKLMASLVDLIEYYKWEYITILYQESYGFERIQDLIKTVDPKKPSKLRIRVRQLGADVSLWSNTIKDVKLSGTSHIIVDIETKFMNEFIRQSEELGLMTAYFHFIFTTLDLSVINFSPSSNVTAIQLFEPNNQLANNLLTELNFKNMINKKDAFKYLPSHATFIFDALSILSSTIKKLNLANKIDLERKPSCQSETSWKYGIEFANYLRLSKLFGVSGHIEFDTKGYRTNSSFAIVDMANDDTVDLVGYWRQNPKIGKRVQIIRSYAKEMDRVSKRLNRNLNVTTKLEAPYIMLASSIGNETLEGNAKYKGFCVDLLEKIAKICNFTYTIRLVEDGLHGTQMKNGKWNGIVRELIDKKSDLAVAALTISFGREQVIDFTKPFLNLGISILYKRPQKKTPSLFSFLAPLSIEIWLYIIAAYFIVSFFLFILARVSPYEWRQKHPCKFSRPTITQSKTIINDFSLFNSLWFTIGSLMQQGIDFNPKSCSTRILTCAWWFFALIMISSYTANLAAFLTTKRLKSPIEDAEGLSRQSEIKYGCLNGGSTQQFFQESKIQTYERMWNFMSNNPENFVRSTEEGISRIKKGGYAYLVESITNEYARARDCDLMQVGGLLDTKGYGIGTPTGSPWREKISNAILQLQENGELQELYSKWWIQSNLNICDRREKNDNKQEFASELSLASVGGVFAVLAGGLILALIVAILEFCWMTRKDYGDQLTMTEKMIRDWKFAVCHTKARLHSSSKRRSISAGRSMSLEKIDSRIIQANKSMIDDKKSPKLHTSKGDLSLNQKISTSTGGFGSKVILISDANTKRVMLKNRSRYYLNDGNNLPAEFIYISGKQQHERHESTPTSSLDRQNCSLRQDKKKIFRL